MADRLANRLLAGALLLLPSFPACMTPRLYAHHTIEGQPFRFTGLAELKQGMTGDAVRSTLGDPLEVAEAGDVMVWRYFERANPRWCDGGSSSVVPPEYSIDAVLVFQDGSLLLHSVRKSGVPQAP
jgi:outer membrane protein assembly factor BamE (lipoprotein component of BamABCDE complex)